MKLSTLDAGKLTKGMFVLVQKTDGCFDIGIAKTAVLPTQKKESLLRVLVLTDCEFEDLPPVFDHTWLPFIAMEMKEIDPCKYPLHPIEVSVVEGLLAEQKSYLEKEKENADALYASAVQRSDEKISDFEREKNFANSLLQSFYDLESMIAKLRK